MSRVVVALTLSTAYADPERCLAQRNTYSNKKVAKTAVVERRMVITFKTKRRGVGGMLFCLW